MLIRQKRDMSMLCPKSPMVLSKSVTPALFIMVLQIPASEKKLRTSSSVTNCGTQW